MPGIPEWFENDEAQLVQTSKVRYFQKSADKVRAVFDNGDAVSAMPPGKTDVDECWGVLQRALSAPKR